MRENRHRLKNWKKIRQKKNKERKKSRARS